MTQMQHSTSNGSAPVWRNWSQNLAHLPPTDGQNWYFMPTSRSELKDIVLNAATMGVTLRVSGQRHSQPALVASDNRGNVPSTPKAFVVDMSCYADLQGPDGITNMIIDSGNLTIKVNTGVREDDVDAALTNENLIMKTVTAGGFFSLGGMTAVDVNGATVAEPIFAETCSSFEVMGPDGTVTTIDGSTPAFEGLSPLDFIRVSLGTLGIVTSVTIKVMPRKYASSLVQKTLTFGPLFDINLERDFINQFKTILTTNDRVESFFNPYADNIVAKSFQVLTWNLVDPDDPEGNQAATPKSACELAHEEDYGAPYLPIIEGISEQAALAAQAASSKDGAKILSFLASLAVDLQVSVANGKHSDLWLSSASRVIFMSYYVELPNIDDEGLSKAWRGLEVVRNYVNSNSSPFHTATPMEFRFIKAGKSALAGTYSTNPNATFINLDLVGFVETQDDQHKGLDYTDQLLQFFAHVERVWVALGGLPHNGKMYGFYDPQNTDTDSFTTPFNPNFLKFITQKRITDHQAPVQTFRDYRAQRDPNGLFYNDYVKALLEP
jgi:FAD/FMN-containing dehydrogenase